MVIFDLFLIRIGSTTVHAFGCSTHLGCYECNTICFMESNIENNLIDFVDFVFPQAK